MIGNDARRRVLFLMGPTASGKTAAACALADRIPVDLISVDSAMVYRGMDIGTAKPDPATLVKYPHQLIDLCDPAEAYSAATFVEDAEAAINAAFARRRLPVLVGGTMLYFKALHEGLAELPSAEPAVREQLEARAREEGLDVLHAELTRLDPGAAAIIHPNNRQRLLRALEVVELTGRPMSKAWAKRPRPLESRLDCEVLQVSLEPARRVLHDNIARRLAVMLQKGFEAEVRQLMTRADLHSALPAMRAVGYRQMWDYLEGGCDERTMVEAVLAATRQLAKRQMTWLRSFDNLFRFDPTGLSRQEVTLKLLDAVAIVDLNS